MSAAVSKEEFIIAQKKGFMSHDSLLGIDHDWNPAIPYDFNDKDDINACKIFNEYNLNLFLDPNMLGIYPDCFYKEIKKLGINPIKTGDLEYLKKYTLDLIGWNYYRPAIIADPKREHEKIDWFNDVGHFITKDALIVFPKDQKYTAWKWLIKPSGLVPGAKILYGRYKSPLMIIENGLGYFDKRKDGIVFDNYRIDYLNIHLRMVQKAIDEGIPFIGYSLWTYCDIFSPSGGYRKKYGIVGVDFENGTLDRYPKTSFKWYQNVIQNRDTYEKDRIPYAKLSHDIKKDYTNKLF